MTARSALRSTAALALALLAVLAVWWRSDPRIPGETGHLELRPLPPAFGATRGDLALAGAWHITSGDHRFGGYSSLVALPGARLLATSDRGMSVEFAMPDTAAALDPRFGSLWTLGRKRWNDVEAVARDPASGTLWMALENSNSIHRVEPGGGTFAATAPPDMAGFSANGGVEAMARLADGRFVALAERPAYLSPMVRTGLLFARDPVSDPRAIRFEFRPPAGFDPTDAAALPDGRVLIVLRAIRLGPWPPFATRIVIADPADIAAGREWPWRELPGVRGLVPDENYEGLAVEPAKDGIVLWLISDANRAVRLQRTLLVKLVWRERAEGAGRP